MDRHSWNLLTLECSDGLQLDALLVAPPDAFATLVHVHGKGGNFYHNSFVRHMYHELPANGVAVLGLNTRGNGAIVEAYRSGDVTYVGAAVERLADSWLDLSAAVGFARARTPRVILQGHSYGCDKVLHCATRGISEELVLISPANSVALQRRYRASSPPPGPAFDRVGDPSKIRLAPADSYGIDTGRRAYWIPVDVATLDGLTAGDDLRTFDWSAEPRHRVSNRSLVLLGDQDDLQLGEIERMAHLCQELLPHGEVIREPGADHQFHGYETALSSYVLDWIGRGHRGDK